MKTIISSIFKNFASIFNFIKKYLYFIIGILIGLLIIYSIIITKKYNSNKDESNRTTEFINNYKFKFDSTRTKNGELQYTVNSLTLKTSELLSYNKDLNKEIEDLNMKVKNLKQVTNIIYRYIYNIDTVQIVKLQGDTTFKVYYVNKYINLSEKINLLNSIKSINVDSVKIAINDSLLITGEQLYKRVWIFWKKPIGIKVHLKSNNPYFNLENFQIINFK